MAIVLIEGGERHVRVRTVGDLLDFIEGKRVSREALLTSSVGRFRADNVYLCIGRDGVLVEESNQLLCIQGD